MRLTRLVVAAGLSLTSSCLAGPWLEFSDAGRDLMTAQTLYGMGPADTIFGDLIDNFDVDLYGIFIKDPLLFSAATVDAPGFLVPDPQLFLFNPAGLAVYMNDDDESGLNGSQSRLEPGHALGPTRPGVYYLGIGWFNNEPFSAGGQMFAESGTGTSGPGPGGQSLLAGWSDNVTGRIDRETQYEISLTGVVHFIPEPSTMLLSGVPLIALMVYVFRRSGR